MIKDSQKVEGKVINKRSQEKTIGLKDFRRAKN
jgi:hypothetical protein